MVYNGYYKVMSNIPKMGHLPTPVENLNDLGCQKRDTSLVNIQKAIENGHRNSGFSH